MHSGGRYQMRVMEKLAFARPAGTEAEARAAGILLEEIKEAGGRGEPMAFSIPAAHVERCEVEVPATGELLPCAAYGRTGSVDGELRLLYLRGGGERDFRGHDDLSGCAVLMDKLTAENYRRLAERHAAAFLTVNGKWYETPETGDLVSYSLRRRYLVHGKVPGVMIWARDAIRLVRDRTETVRVTLIQRDVEKTSRNVLAAVPGTERPDESILITAHYDSEQVGTGSYDNASGAATALALFRYFSAHPQRRTLRFLWCGAEEEGLLGSRAYVAAYPAIVDNELLACVNYDMCGTVLGENSLEVAGVAGSMPWTERYCEEVGWPAEISAFPDSSDGAPFANRDIPCFNPGRCSETVEEHTRHDRLFPLSAEAMADMETFSIGLIARLAEAEPFPIPKGMTEELRRDLDEMLS